MIKIKNKTSLEKMAYAGTLLSSIFKKLETFIQPGLTTLAIDEWIEKELIAAGLKSQTKGYMGYKHASCVSVNDVVVHGVPSSAITLQAGDLVKIDVCAAWEGYCADMARSFLLGPVDKKVEQLAYIAQQALNKGIEKARVGNRLTDISAAIQQEVERAGFGVVRDFAGHGIGKQMHEEPEVLNYGQPGQGPLLRHGMTLAIEPMITMGHYDVYVAKDGWTVKTVDKSLAAHVEDTIAILQEGPKVLTRVSA